MSYLSNLIKQARDGLAPTRDYTPEPDKILEVREFTCPSCRANHNVFIYNRGSELSSIDCLSCKAYFWWNPKTEQLLRRDAQTIISGKPYRLVS